MRDPRLISALALLAAVLLVVLTLRIRRWWKARLLGARMDTAAEGEVLAERWLAANGYRILERQASRRCIMHINGRVAEYDVRADLLVQRDEQRLLVEVKTGEAADPRFPATRRQLREYAAVFEVDAVYLFDATNLRLHHIEFVE